MSALASGGPNPTKSREPGHRAGFARPSGLYSSLAGLPLRIREVRQLSASFSGKQEKSLYMG